MFFAFWSTLPQKNCDTVVSAICKLYIVVFGLSVRTPRDALFEVIQTNPRNNFKNKIMWVTTVVETQKAVNSVKGE